MTAGRRPTVRGRSRRATCPECGRIIAAVMDRHALLAGAGISFLLHPHNVEAGRPCRGWRVDRDALTED